MASGPCRRLVVGARGRSSVLTSSYAASTASRTPRPSKSRAAAKFSAGGVESWQKSRPAGRHCVEIGAAEQRCYKGAFAPGLGRLGRAHDDDERSLDSFSFWPPAGTAENGNEREAFALRYLEISWKSLGFLRFLHISNWFRIFLFLPQATHRFQKALSLEDPH